MTGDVKEGSGGTEVRWRGLKPGLEQMAFVASHQAHSIRSTLTTTARLSRLGMRCRFHQGYDSVTSPKGLIILAHATP